MAGQDEEAAMLAGFDWLDFTVWDPDGDLPGIDAERASEVYGRDHVKPAE